MSYLMECLLLLFYNNCASDISKKKMYIFMLIILHIFSKEKIGGKIDAKYFPF